MACSINAIGGAFNRSPRYDLFPVEEQHLTQAEETYSLSKWVLEQQANAFTGCFEWRSIANLRLHLLIDTHEAALRPTTGMGEYATRPLQAYTLSSEGKGACLFSLTADSAGYYVFYVVAPNTATSDPFLELERQDYPHSKICRDLSNQIGFFNCSKATRLYGWQNKEN